MEQESIEIFSHPDFADRAKLFYEKYDLLDMKRNGDTTYSKRNLMRHTSRTCRFCGRSYPYTLFSNYPHLLPQLIGNRDMYSDFECDDCNAFFSVFENDLDEFLGISRSITAPNSQKKAPEFMGRRLRAGSGSFIGNNILIIAPGDLEREGNKIITRYTKNAYMPSGVYKALLKSALSLFDEKEVNKNYLHAIDYLLGKSITGRGAVIAGYKLSFQLNLPLHVYLFRKKVKAEKIPTHILTFHFQNIIIVFPVPLHEEDILFDTTEYKFVIPPPYFTNRENMAMAIPMAFERDLSSAEKVLDEEETVTFLLDVEALKNSSSYDPITDQYKPEEYNPAGTKYLILTREGTRVNPKELSGFIKNQMKKNN